MELWDLYDKNRNKTGKDWIRGNRLPDGYYRLVVHLAIFNDDGKMLIQQRQPFKNGWQNLWDISVGGSAQKGDDSNTAIERELREELGVIRDFSSARPKLILNFSNGFDDIYILNENIDLSTLTLQPEEVQAVKWATETEIIEMINDGIFIPYHPSLISALFHLKDHSGFHTRPDKQ